MSDILSLYKKTLRIRYFEEKIDWLFSRGRLGGTTHLCIGQEAVAVGVDDALSPDDYVVSNHRGHGHLIARGADPARLFAELLGKPEGYCRGRGGTQHLSIANLNFLGTNGITGGGIPIATGAGLSIKLSGEERISVCFFGDGASNQGTFHESLNMASAWSLPVLYVCENNVYAMSTRFSKVSRLTDVSARASAYGMPSAVVDGMDAVKVSDAARMLAVRIRAGHGPALLEAKTYRYCGHSKSDARAYRSRDEEALWRRKDPVLLLEKQLSGLLSASDIETLRSRAVSEIEDAYQSAMLMREPGVHDAFEGVYADTESYVPQGNL